MINVEYIYSNENSTLCHMVDSLTNQSQYDKSIFLFDFNLSYFFFLTRFFALIWPIQGGDDTMRNIRNFSVFVKIVKIENVYFLLRCDIFRITILLVESFYSMINWSNSSFFSFSLIISTLNKIIIKEILILSIILIIIDGRLLRNKIIDVHTWHTIVSLNGT